MRRAMEKVAWPYLLRRIVLDSEAWGLGDGDRITFAQRQRASILSE